MNTLRPGYGDTSETSGDLVETLVWARELWWAFESWVQAGKPGDILDQIGLFGGILAPILEES